METLFAPVRREATREKVCAAIRDAIVAGRLAIGQRLPEGQLTREFEVSRGVVREAIQQLAHEGLVEQTVNRGARVVDLTAAQVDEIVGLRVILECEAVRLARGRMTPADAQLLETLARDVDAARHDVRLFVRRDLAFHEAVWRVSGNSTLIRHLTLLTAPVFSMGIIVRHSRVVSERGPVPLLASDHAALARALMGVDEAAAADAIRRHITENWDRTRTAIEQLHAPAAVRRRRAPRAI